MNSCKRYELPDCIKCLLVFALFFLLQPLTVHAQKKGIQNRFGAGITLGLSTTQINGDFLSGYDKFGAFVGVRALARLDKKSDLVIELQYNRKGSRDPNEFVPGQTARRFISLDYIEIPILFQRAIEIKTMRCSIEGGIAYAQLFGFKINENPGTTRYNTFTSIQDEFNNQDVALLIGGGVMLNEHIRLMMRFSYSVALLYENENPIRNLPGDLPEINSLRNIQLAIGANYIFL